MRRIIPISLFALIFNLAGQAQTNNSVSKEIANNKKTVGLKPKESPQIIPEKNMNDSESIEISLNEKAEGFGPDGIVSHGIASNNMLDSLERKALPKMKNIPNGLTNVVEYCFQLNSFQFFYQNYRNGVFPKDYF